MQKQERLRMIRSKAKITWRSKLLCMLYHTVLETVIAASPRWYCGADIEQMAETAQPSTAKIMAE
jgi:hypothetical protein